MLTMGALYFLVSNLTPEAIEARRQAKTETALLQAREALLGYALKSRDEESSQGRPDRMYGYLPLPDLGSSRNNNTDPNCKDASNNPLEGCDANTPTGIACDANNIYPTMIGRLPWRTLGTGPLRDGHGECLWLIVSSLHLRKQCSNPTLPPMNWDTLGQLDIVTANGTSALTSALTIHDRPIAIIFAPGPPLAGQNRDSSTADDVRQCGGNYDAANYLDPATANATALGGITNYLAGTNNASDVTGDSDTSNDPDNTQKKNLLLQGKVFKSGTNYLSGGCTGNDCDLLTNDVGLSINSDMLFGAIRKSAYFRTDINSMLDRMVSCLRDEIQTPATFTPMTLTNPSSTSVKAAGRIYSSSCFDDTATPVNTINPKGYFTHYRNHIFVAACPGSLHTVITDPGKPNQQTLACAGALMFSGPRDPLTQSRTNPTERNTASNYLEDDIATNGNLSGFSALLNTDYASCAAAKRFAGAGTFSSLASGQAAHQDIVRCIPSSPSLNVVAPAVAATTGAVQLASYVPSARTLTLGSAGINSNAGAVADKLFACAWDPEIHAADGGFRSYFRFRIRQVGEGFTFAVIDGDRNGSNVCGAARQHLGYSGDNGITPYIQAPKLAIEFDTLRNGGFLDSPASLSGGRNDPCYQVSCGAAQTLSSNAHVGVMYWGYGAADATIPVNYPKQDDNVHGFPWPPDSSVRPAPRNSYYAGTPYPTPPPDPALNIAPLDRMGATSPLDEAPAKREFHARLEVTRSFSAPADAKEGSTGLQVKLWIEPHAAANITAMTYNSGSPPTLTVTTSTAHNLNTGSYVVIKDAIPTGYNGEYPITRIDANSFTATLPGGKADPGRYISSITWADNSFGTDQATVTSPGHGLNTGDTITISGAVPTEYNVSNRTITRITADIYRFDLELGYEPGNMPPAIAAARALTPRAIALANTARPMSELDASFKPIITDSATIYDEQLALPADCTITPCNPGSSCGSDKKCYQPSFRNLRLGFTVGERVTSSLSTARGQLIEIKDRATTWLP
jgi:hypothetical protein